MAHFFDLIRDMERPVRILDVGGTPSIWESFNVLGNGQFSLTFFNLEASSRSLHPNVRFRQGDARDLSCFADREFDVVFSNSLIEHVGNAAQQALCASEIRRVAKQYFVQTPYYFFPIEPHFLLPGFQFLPSPLRAWIFWLLPVGHVPRARSLAEAKKEVEGLHLLTKRELLSLFPGSHVIEERFFGLTKSLIAVSHR